MDQYLQLLKDIKEKGTHKPAARANMPGSTSLFGAQLRFDLQKGFPAITTKKLYWKGIVAELLWFLRGDTNIKYLVDNGANFWNEDAYNYYLKIAKRKKIQKHKILEFDDFIKAIKDNWVQANLPSDYKLGDCGYQYGKVWRNWDKYNAQGDGTYHARYLDQIANVIKSLQEAPESRRHIVTAVDPAHDTDLALYWCHSMFQFNCRPISEEGRRQLAVKMKLHEDGGFQEAYAFAVYKHDVFDKFNVPKYKLDCQLYQRSADVFLGVPFNIASYALLTHIIAKIVNMIPGEFIHTFGDVHIYDNHMDAVNEQLTREPLPLPKLRINPNLDWSVLTNGSITEWKFLLIEDFQLEGYQSHPAIKAELSTGLKK